VNDGGQCNIKLQQGHELSGVVLGDATGQFKFSPVYSYEEIVMFADEDESVRKKGERVFSGANTVADFPQQLAWLVNTPKGLEPSTFGSTVR